MCSSFWPSFSHFPSLPSVLRVSSTISNFPWFSFSVSFPNLLVIVSLISFPFPCLFSLSPSISLALSSYGILSLPLALFLPLSPSLSSPLLHSLALVLFVYKVLLFFHSLYLTSWYSRPPGSVSSFLLRSSSRSLLPLRCPPPFFFSSSLLVPYPPRFFTKISLLLPSLSRSNSRFSL